MKNMTDRREFRDTWRLKFGMYHDHGIFQKVEVGILKFWIFGPFLVVQSPKNVKNHKNLDFGPPEIGQK